MRANGGSARRRTAALFVLLLTLTVGVDACDADGAKLNPPTGTGTGPASKPSKLTFGVWGTDEEIAAYQDVADIYNSLSDDSAVKVLSWSSQEAERAALRAGGPVPDVFMLARGDLAWLGDQDLNEPVDELLDERGVDFGDGYSRDALRAFAADNRLQCMPYGISPMVIYYNTELIDFERMRERELAAPSDDEHTRWSFEQFAAAADFATRPRTHTRGLSVEPTLRGLAPFIYSGGGEVFNDDSDPTSLAFSSGDTQDALTTTLALLRDASLNLTEKQLAKASPLEWFERGRLGMIEGFRSLVPELRQVPGLEFDVMPMPVLDTAATVGDITGLCLSADTADTPEAADFLVYATSADSVRRVVRAGYLAPANLGVSLSEDFLQPGRLPEHSSVFNNSVRALEIAPLIDTLAELESAVSSSLQELVNVTVLNLEELTAQIDEESIPVLDPDSVPETPDADPSN